MEMNGRGAKTVCAFAAIVMISGAFAVFDSENVSAASWSFDLGNWNSMPTYVSMNTGDYVEFRITGQVLGPNDMPRGLARMHELFPELEYVHNVGGFLGWVHDYYLRGNVQNGTHSIKFEFTERVHYEKTITFEIFNQITYVRDDGSELRTDRTHSTSVTLPDPGPISDPAFRWGWYSDPNNASTLKGYAGSPYQFSGAQKLYAKQVRTSTAITPSSADVYVHYLGSFSYTLDSIVPEGSTIRAEWIRWSGDLPPLPSIGGKTISMDETEMAEGTYTLRVTASKEGIQPASMTLNVHIYPHEILPLDNTGFGPWSYTISTINSENTMSLIRASRIAGSDVIPIQNSSVSVDNVNRTVGYDFSEPGIYEFALKITADDPNANITKIYRVMATDEIVTQIPSVSGIQTVNNPNIGNNCDLVLVDPQNYVSILWDYGDGTTELNKNTTRNHTYSPGIYTVTVTLSNSLNDTCTVTKTIEALSPRTPSEARLNLKYEATVAVAASGPSDVAVECPDWMSYEFIQRDLGNYVLISGTFSDERLVESFVNVTVSSSGIIDKTWRVALMPPRISSLHPSFDWRDAGSQRIDVKYTGPLDRWTHVYFIWPGSGDSAYYPDAEGWMRSPQLPSGTAEVKAKAVRPGIVSETVTRYVTIPYVSDTQGENPGGSGSGDGDGTGGSGNDAGRSGNGNGNTAMYVTAGMILSSLLFIGTLVTGRYGFAAIFGIIAISIALFGGSFEELIEEVLGGIL